MTVGADVRPLSGHGWLAVCECGEENPVDGQEIGWQWVLGHACADIGDERRDEQVNDHTGAQG